MLQTALHYSHTLVKEIIQSGDIAIDATMGNGHDTLFLARAVGETGHVYAFDVQAAAVQRTKERLNEQQLAARTQLFLAGHETIEETLAPETPVKAALFNLGYLPKSDKQIITLPETTKRAMTAILHRLVAGGRMILVIYYGHAGGEEEKDAVLSYCRALPQQTYTVMTYQFLNQQNDPPILVCVEKK